jgi:hypothetical protein
LPGLALNRNPPDLCPISFFFIHMCIQCLGHFSPLLPTPSLTPPNPSLPGRNYFALISNFVEERV